MSFGFIFVFETIMAVLTDVLLFGLMLPVEEIVEVVSKFLCGPDKPVDGKAVRLKALRLKEGTSKKN